MGVTLKPPLSEEDTRALSAGDHVLITGTIYTARDAAHSRLAALIERGEELPVELAGQIIYYVGPTPASPGRAVGSAGPTTSSRMDAYTAAILSRGVRALIGKGERSPEVAAAIRECGAVYLAAVGGAGALLAERVTAAEAVVYPELGPEAVYRFDVVKFPAIVIIDAHGGDLYRSGRERYRR